MPDREKLKRLRDPSGGRSWGRVAAACFAVSIGVLQARGSSPATDLVIMLDTSVADQAAATTQDPMVRTLSGGARIAASQLRPGDRVSLVVFSGNVKTIVALTTDVREFESAVRKTGRWIVERNERHLYDALLTALAIFPETVQSDRRRCIMVLTTASDAGSKHNAAEVVLAARAKSTAIFVALLLPQPSRPRLMPGGRIYSSGPIANEKEEKKILEPLARETGGDIRSYEANPYAIARAIREMVRTEAVAGDSLPASGMALKPAAPQNARAVSLDVQVIDPRTGEIPELLGPHDFEVYDDGQRIPVRSVAIDTPPIDLVFLIYMSNPGLSSRVDRQRYERGLNAVVTELREHDRAGVIRGSGPRGECLRLTGDIAAVRQALLDGHGAQPDRDRLFDAVSSALPLLSVQTSPQRRRSIIAITDDIERHSETKQDVLEEKLLRAGVTLHEVMLALVPVGSRVYAGAPPIPGLHIPPVSGVVGKGNSAAASLVDIARATGGEIQIGDDFDAALPALIRRLRMRYTLNIEGPVTTRAFHRIDVRLTPESRSAHPDVTVRTATGYYSEPHARQ